MSFQQLKAARSQRQSLQQKISGVTQQTLQAGSSIASGSTREVEQPITEPSSQASSSKTFDSSEVSLMRNPDEEISVSKELVDTGYSNDAKVDVTAGPSKAKGGETLLVNDVNEVLGFTGSSIEVIETPGKGRGLIAKKAFCPGDRIYSTTTRAIPSALSTKHLSSHCSNCYLSSRDSAALNRREERPLLRCSACKVIWYCHKDCATADWHLHAPECKALQAARPKAATVAGKGKLPEASSTYWIPPEWVRALGRLAWRRKKWMDEKGEEMPAWKEYILMQTHPNTSEEKQKELQTLSKQLSAYLSASGNPPPIAKAEVQELVQRLQTNAFTLSSPDLSPIGVLLHPQAAMANHSCEPNAVIVFPLGAGRGIDIVAIREISPGQEVLTAYIDVSSPYISRQAELDTTYHFQCSCSLCSLFTQSHPSADQTAILQSPPMDPRWCLLHLNCTSSPKGLITMSTIFRPQSAGILIKVLDQGLGWDGIAKGKCSVCGKDDEVDIRGLPGLVKRGQEVLQMDEHGRIWDVLGSRNKPSNAITVVTSLIAELSRYLPTSSYPILPLLRVLSLLYLPPTSGKDCHNAIQILTEYLNAASSVYPMNHPTLAVIASERASLCHAWGEMDDDTVGVRDKVRMLEQSGRWAREAAGACEKGFGKAVGGGLVGIQMRGMIEQVELEIRELRMGQGFG